MKTLLLSILTLCACTVAAPADEPDYQARIKQMGVVANSASKDIGDLKKNLKESVAINENQGKELGAVKSQIVDLSKVLSDTLKENAELKAANAHEWRKGFFGGVIASMIGVGLILALVQKFKKVPASKESPEPDRSIPPPAQPRRRTKLTAKKTR